MLDKLMKKVYRIFGFTTEYWAIDIFENENISLYEIIIPMDEVEAGEVFSAQVKILTFWLFNKPIFMRLNENEFEEFVNPHIAAK